MGKLYAVPEYIVDKKLNHIKKHLEEIAPDVAYRYQDISLSVLAEDMGLNSFDTALPQALVDDIREATGQSVVGHAVFCYDGNNWGVLTGVTDHGKLVISIYNHLLESRP